MASTTISRTMAANNEKKLTVSMWVKRSKIGSEQFLLGSYYSGSYWGDIRFNGDDTITFADYRNGYILKLVTNAKFRDTHSWYHIVCNYDISIGSPTAKIYVNGELQTLSTNTIYSQNATTSWNTDYSLRIGSYNSNTYFDGIMADFYFIQGYTYEASTFGETDSTTGEWKPNTNPTINYGGTGGNSCNLKFENSANMDLDSGSNNVSFTTSGTLTQTQDNPSNVFCAFNPLIRPVNIFYAKTNSRIEISSGNSWQTGFGTLGMEKGSGKYYMEFKLINGTKAAFGIADYKAAGVIDRVQRNENRYLGEYANSYGYHYGGNFYYNGSSTSSGWDSFTTSNIIGMAVDMENMKLYFHKDGTYQNSGNPSAGSGGYSINDPENCYLPAVSIEACAACANWGNGTFDGTAISSEGTNASGIGKFEYDVPTGYTALSTKGLNE